MNGEKKNKTFWKYILKIVIALVVLVITYIAFLMMEKVNGVKSVFQNIEHQEASLTEYIVYGTHLNINGELNIKDIDISNISLCFKTIDNEKNEEFIMKYENTSNGIKFYTSELINEGIDLEKLDEETYYLFLKIKDEASNYKFYSIKNATKYENTEYYTITKNGKNNKVDINFNSYNMADSKIDYMYLNVRYSALPDEVYDIAIDPGHGRKRYRSRSKWI